MVLPVAIGLVMPLVWRLTKYRCCGYVSYNLTCGVWLTLQTVCTAVTLVISIGLVMLLVWNMYLIANNMTTIEYHEGVTAQIQVRNPPLFSF